MTTRLLYGVSLHFASGHHVELMTTDADLRTTLLPTLKERPNDLVVELVEFTLQAADEDDAPRHSPDEGDICDCPACRTRRAPRYH